MESGGVQCTVAALESVIAPAVVLQWYTIGYPRGFEISAVSALTSPRTGGWRSEARFSITGEYAPSTLRVLSFEQPVRIAKTKIPTQSPRWRFMEGKCSFLGDTAVPAGNPIRSGGIPSTRRLGRVGLHAQVMGLRLAQGGEEGGRGLAAAQRVPHRFFF